MHSVKRNHCRPVKALAQDLDRLPNFGRPRHQPGEWLQAHIQAVEHAAAPDCVSVEYSVGVLREWCFSVESVSAAAYGAEVVEDRLRACGSDLEEHSVFVCPARSGYPIEITVGTQRQTSVGICSVRIAGEVVQNGQDSSGSDFEH